jgi:GDP-mannose 6-dehydrogenase
MDNAFHATKVAFANEAGRVAAAYGVSAAVTHEIFVADTKLNVSPYYLRPGGAFGGSCLPKDVRALSHLAREKGEIIPVIDGLLASNDAHKEFLFRYACEGLEPGARVLLVGLTFKALTDDLRESPNVDLAEMLLKAEYHLEIYDPVLEGAVLVGQNLGFVLSRLPGVEQLLVSGEALKSRAYDRIIDTNGLAGEISGLTGPVVSIASLS